MHSKSRLAAVILVLFVVGASELSTGELGRAGHPPDGRQVVVVYLRDQRQFGIAQEVQEEYEPRQRELSRILQTTYEGGQGVAVYEMRLVHRRASEVLDALRRAMRQEILARSESARAASQSRVASSVIAQGGEVLYRYSSVNAMAVAIPEGGIEALAAHPDVAEVHEDRLLRGQMDVSPAAIGAPTWWALGYTGGATDVAVIDSGVDDSHPALDPQFVLHQRCLDTADYWEDHLPAGDPTADDVNGHGTHVAGTVAMTSTVQPYLGVAHGLDALLNGKAGFDYSGGAWMYWSDGMACADWALVSAPDDAEVINLSYGGDTFGADDGGYERFWDAVVDQMDVVVTVSAGNAGPLTGTLTSPSIAYNVISVANINDGGTVNRANDVIYWSSSRGPTPGGRRKPDLAAPGARIESANNDWEGGADYVPYWGTSMAAPHVAGAAALLMDRGIVSPMAIKALLINTAEDLGPPGWDISYGWGYIDLNNLDSHVTDYFSGTIGPAPEYQLYAGPANGGDTSTLVWHRRAVYQGGSYPGTYYTLTDLDLFAYNEDTNGPVDASYSGRDNVEQVVFTATHPAVIRVDAWSSTINGALLEDYVLATEESFAAVRGPAFGMDLVTAGDIGGPMGELLTVTLSVTNTGDLRAHNVILYPWYSSGLQLTSAQTLTVGQLGVGASISGATWTFSKTTDSPQAIWLRASSNSYQELFTAVTRWGGEAFYLPLLGRNY